MVSFFSKGVKISVESIYTPELSNPFAWEFMFSYKITIENQNIFPIQITRRHWNIFDSDGSRREVDADGILGLVPIIDPGNSHEYVSGCNLHTEIGSMIGYYHAINIHTREKFKLEIPGFYLCTPFKLN